MGQKIEGALLGERANNLSVQLVVRIKSEAHCRM